MGPYDYDDRDLIDLKTELMEVYDYSWEDVEYYDMRECKEALAEELRREQEREDAWDSEDGGPLFPNWD